MQGVLPESVHCAVGSLVASAARRLDEPSSVVLNPPDASTRVTESLSRSASGVSGGGGALGGRSSSCVMVSASASVQVYSN